MKNFKKSLLLLSLVFVVFITSACAGIQKRSMYEGNIMGIKVQMLVDHRGDKLVKVESEMEIPKEMGETLSKLAGKTVNPRDTSNLGNQDDRSLELFLKSFNGASLRMFNGAEFNIDNIGGKIVIKSLVDYKKVDKETIQEIIKFAPGQVTNGMDDDDFDSFSKFEENLLQKGLTKKY